MRETRHWGNFPERLAASLPEANITLLDLPGNGKLHLQRSPTSVTAMANACRQQLLERGLKPPYNLLALSLGAMVSCNWSSHYQGEIERAVLINTSLRPFSPFYHRLRPANYPKLLRLMSGVTDKKTREHLILQATSNRDVSLALVEQWTEFVQQYPVSRRNILRQLRAATSYKAPLSAPPSQLLILSSDGDHLVNPRCSARLSQQWQVPLQTHPWAGHDLTLDDPEWVIKQIEGWIRHFPTNSST